MPQNPSPAYIELCCSWQNYSTLDTGERLTYLASHEGLTFNEVVFLIAMEWLDTDASQLALKLLAGISDDSGELVQVYAKIFESTLSRETRQH